LRPVTFLLEERMESYRQAFCTMYVALAEAAGGHDVLRRANAIIRDGLEDQVIDDPEGARILADMVEGIDGELATIEAPAADYTWLDDLLASAAA
jgi:hypothetical protein